MHAGTRVRAPTQTLIRRAIGLKRTGPSSDSEPKTLSEGKTGKLQNLGSFPFVPCPLVSSYSTAAICCASSAASSTPATGRNQRGSPPPKPYQVEGRRRRPLSRPLLVLDCSGEQIHPGLIRFLLSLVLLPGGKINCTTCGCSLFCRQRERERDLGGFEPPHAPG